MSKILKSTIVAVLLLIVVSPAVIAASFSQSYSSNAQLSKGTVVSITKTGSDQIEPATAANDGLIVGVVAEAVSSSIVDFQPKSSNTRVTISGETQIMVTNSDGDIQKGDKLVISPLAGIATRDNSSSAATKYIGVANQSFSASTSGAQKTNVQLSDGSKKDVAVGLIDATVQLSNRQAGQSTKDRNILTEIGERITGRSVSPFRVLASAVTLLAVFSITGWVLYGSISSSFVSLGRNPLARFNIIINLMRAIMIALVVFAAGITVSYLVLVL